MGLLRFLAIAALIYMLFRIIVRFLLPWLTRSAVKKASERMEEQMKRRKEGEKVYQDGEVVIRKGQAKKKPDQSKSDDDDEYIDFEEV